MKKIINTTSSDDIPLKWRKHLILTEWKIRSIKDLENTIKRFKVADYLLCFEEIRSQILFQEGTHIYIIKLVNKLNFYKLPNIIISSLDDLERVEHEIFKFNTTFFSEIWYCKILTAGNRTVFGRMLINNSQLFPRSEIHYDLIWGNSARSIENYPNIENNFISYDKINWNAEPIVSAIKIYDLKKSDIKKISSDIIAKTSAYTFEIIDFATYVFSQGCNHLCLEFSYSNNELNFIDWDSDNDRAIINRY